MKHKDNHKHGHPETADPEVDLAGAPVEGTPPEAGTPADEKSAASGGEETAKQQASPNASHPSEEEAKLRDRLLRLQADFDNYRKRQLREREDWIKRANEELLGDLLPVIDHLELALAQATDPAAPFVVGVKLVYDQFLALLDRHGMVPLDAKGEPFDPSYHEALSQMNSATVPANIVMDQFRRGWLLGGRLLRPAQVIVSSGAPDPVIADNEPSNVTD